MKKLILVLIILVLYFSCSDVMNDNSSDDVEEQKAFFRCIK